MRTNIKTLKNLIHKSKNNGGFSLISILILIVGVGALSVFIMSNQRARTKQGAKQAADVEVDMAVNKLASYLNSSNHCNAVFRGRGIAGSTYVQGPPENPGVALTGHIQTCSTSSCSYGSGVNTFAIGSTSWDAGTTGFPMGTKVVPNGNNIGVSSRIRIARANISIDTSFGVPAPTPSGEFKPWMARLKIRFEKNLMQRRPDGSTFTTNVDRYIFFPVTLNNKNVAINSTSISGCPRSSNSTVLP